MACVNIASGIAKSIFYKKEDVCWGDIPSVLTGAKTIRRVTGNFQLNKEGVTSEELRTDYQMQDFRHGNRMVEGSVNGELSPGSYSDLIGSALRRDFTAGVTLSGVSVDAVAMTSKVTRATGSWIASGIKAGDVVRFTGFTAPALANNNKNFIVVAVTALDLTVVSLDKTPLVAATGATVTAVVQGKKTFIPTSGHTDDSYTFEEWYSDIAQSEVYTGNKVNTVGIQIPATGMATVDFAFMGKDRYSTGTTQFFSSPAPQASTGVFQGANGALVVNGAVIALVTSLSININNNISGDPVVGSNTKPDLFQGRCLVDGEFSAYFTDRQIADYFDDEVEISLIAALTTDNSASADFVTVVLPRIKVNSDTKSDGEQGIVSSHSFQALKGVGANNYEATTIQIQDSAAV